MAQVNKILRSFVDGELWDASDVYDIVNVVNNVVESNNDINNEITIARDGKTSLHERINRDVGIVSQYSQNAANSAQAAAISEANALLYKNQANTYKEDSYKWANTNENIQVVDSLNRTGYSSYHYAKKAQQSATNAATSASIALNASNTLTSYLNGTTMPNLSCDMVDGYHASQIPAPNVILPLNANARIYNYVAKGIEVFYPTPFIMSNLIQYLIGSLNITTPSWSPSGSWKIIFNIASFITLNTGGANTFSHIIKYNDFDQMGASWYWYSPNGGFGFGCSDTFLISELPNNTTTTFNFYVSIALGNANAIYHITALQWYLIPA